MTWLDRIMVGSIVALLAGMLALAGWPSWLNWRRRLGSYEDLTERSHRGR